MRTVVLTQYHTYSSAISIIVAGHHYQNVLLGTIHLAQHALMHWTPSVVLELDWHPLGLEVAILTSSWTTIPTAQDVAIVGTDSSAEEQVWLMQFGGKFVHNLLHTMAEITRGVNKTFLTSLLALLCRNCSYLVNLLAIMICTPHVPLPLH